jgi:hypothetical protein
MFYNIGPRAQCYKTFYVCNLIMLVISWSVCPCQVFPALANARLALYKAGKACQGQTLELITKIRKSRP